MLSEYFQTRVQEAFKSLEKKYKLSLVIEKDKVKYQSKNINFTVYYERNFEVYIVFILKKCPNNGSVDLSSIINYLNIGVCLTGSQVSCENDIDYVLGNLSNIMDIILDRIFKDEDLLYNAYLYEKQINKEKYNQYLIEQMSLNFSKEWSNKNYHAFVEIYIKNKQRDKDIDLYLNEKQKKQLEYSKKMVVNN